MNYIYLCSTISYKEKIQYNVNIHIYMYLLNTVIKYSIKKVQYFCMVTKFWPELGHKTDMYIFLEGFRE